MSKINRASNTLQDQLGAALKTGTLVIPSPPKKIPYPKPAMSPEGLLSLMESRGLTISDKDKALHYLTFIGYFRISGYARSFFKPGSEEFIDGTTFDDVFTIYKFDRKLRFLILDILKRVEIATRAVISNHMSLKYGPHWFMDSGYFLKEKDHSESLEEIRRSRDKQRGENLVAHYYRTYSEPDFPPSWVICEIMSIGFWSKIYMNIQANADKSAIASKFGLNPPVMKSFLHCTAALRNICAHHSRVWNRTFGIKPIKYREYPEIFRRNETLYAQLAVLNIFTNIIADGSSWKIRLADLLDQYPSINLVSMGFPVDWKNDPFWGLT